MSANNRQPVPGTLADFFRDPEPTNAQVLAEVRALSAKVDALRADLVKPMSRIILAGDDIARIAAEIARAAAQGPVVQHDASMSAPQGPEDTGSQVHPSMGLPSRPDYSKP